MITEKHHIKLELRHLRSFMVVAEQLNFRRAADQMHIAQPALSRQIAQLEEALQASLFDRSKRQIRLTPAGEFLYQRVPDLFAELQATIEQVGQIAGGRSVALRFGYSSAAMSSFLPALINTLQNQLDDCQFNFVEATSERIIDSVVNRKLDAGFILFRPELEGLRCLPIREDPIGVILHAEHALASRREISFEDLRQESLILFPRKTNPPMYDEILACCQQAGFSPAKIIETAPRSTAIGLVAAGQGVATIAASLAHTCVAGTVYRPLRQPGPLIRYSCVVRADTQDFWLQIVEEYIRRHL